MKYCSIWLHINETDPKFFGGNEAKEEGMLAHFYEVGYQQCSSNTYVELCHEGGPHGHELFIFNDLHCAISFYDEGYRDFEVYCPQRRKGYGFRKVSLHFGGFVIQTKKAAGSMLTKAGIELGWPPIAHPNP